MVRKTGIKIRFSPLPYGYIAEPVSKVWRKRFADHMGQWLPGIPDKELPQVFFQGYWELPKDDIPSYALRELGRGWDIVCLIDPWIFAHWLGYDAHKVVTGG
jgi:hypothetical protein